jgi:hypothetical protein
VGGELLFLIFGAFLVVSLSALTRRFGCRNFKIDAEQMALEAADKEASEKELAEKAVRDMRQK